MKRNYVSKMSGILNNPKKVLNTKQDKMVALTKEDIRNMMNKEEDSNIIDGIEVGTEKDLIGYNYYIENNLIKIYHFNKSPDIYKDIINTTIFGKYRINNVIYDTILTKDPDLWMNYINIYDNYCYAKNIKINNGVLCDPTITEIQLFSNAQCIKNIEICGEINSDNVTSLYGLFRFCIGLENITGLHNLNTKNVTMYKNMFELCQSLKSIDLSSFNISENAKVDLMFGSTHLLEEVLVSREKCKKDFTSTNAFNDSKINNITYID